MGLDHRAICMVQPDTHTWLAWVRGMRNAVETGRKERDGGEAKVCAWAWPGHDYNDERLSGGEQATGVNLATGIHNVHQWCRYISANYFPMPQDLSPLTGSLRFVSFWFHERLKLTSYPLCLLWGAF